MKNSHFLLVVLSILSSESFVNKLSSHLKHSKIKSFGLNTDLYYSKTTLKSTQDDKYHKSRCDLYADIIDKNLGKVKIISYIVRFLNMFIVGSLFRFILTVLNKFKTKRSDRLFRHIWNRADDRGLLTISNHKSFYDDPGLWSALLPYWSISPKQMRWSLCTQEVFFSVSNFL